MKHLDSLAPRPALLGLLIGLSLVLTACGSSAAGTTPSAAIPQTGGALVQSANNPKFGQILVTADGKVLYTNTIDTPNASKCTDTTCTGFWQPYTVSMKPTAGQGVSGSVGVITRPDGSTQVTYNQKPLYTFYLDKQAGDAGGDGLSDLGGTWHIATVSGSPAPAASGGSGSSGGYQYP